ncbi:MAG: glycosyltransferase involved in cell wall biosynthesis [Desulforhopalus sp.]|jgi:glycosyltransferase involved in cell wall biosynthesis
MKHFNSLVSVIMPVYNGSEYIEDAISSVLTQTHHDIELVIIDDGSTDQTALVVEKIADIDNRVRYIKQKNKGPAAARNKGILESKGFFISFLDADDIWIKNKLEKQLCFLERDENIVVYGGSQYIYNTIDAPKKPRVVNFKNFSSNEEFLEHLAFSSSSEIAFTCAVLLKKTLLDEVGYFDETLQNAEDWDVWLRLACKYNFYALQEIVFLRRKHHSSQTSTLMLDKMIQNEITVLNKLEKMQKRPQLPFSKIYGLKYNEIAHHLRSRKRHLDAIKFMKKSICVYPNLFFSLAVIKFFIATTLSLILNPILGDSSD